MVNLIVYWRVETTENGLFILDIITEESNKKKEVYKIAENRLFIRKQTKIRVKWAKGLLNRPKSVKTDRVNNTAIFHRHNFFFLHFK